MASCFICSGRSAPQGTCVEPLALGRGRAAWRSSPSVRRTKSTMCCRPAARRSTAPAAGRRAHRARCRSLANNRPAPPIARAPRHEVVIARDAAVQRAGTAPSARPTWFFASVSSRRRKGEHRRAPFRPSSTGLCRQPAFQFTHIARIAQAQAVRGESSAAEQGQQREQAKVFGLQLGVALHVLGTTGGVARRVLILSILDAAAPRSVPAQLRRGSAMRSASEIASLEGQLWCHADRSRRAPRRPSAPFGRAAVVVHPAL